MGFPPALAARLQAREAAGTQRRLTRPDSALVDFASNDYLGVVRDGHLTALLRDHLAQTTTWLAGATGSRLLTGNSAEAERLEGRLAAYHRAESALLFGSGYAANAGFFGAVPQRADTVLYDERVHASVRDGLRLGLARALSFRHNDLADLARKLRHVRPGGVGYVAVESLYSMDGDLAPLPELAAFCGAHGLYLVVDEAHTTGTHGPGGAGRVVELGLEDAVFARLLTFGKALGAGGAAWVGPGALRDFLVNFARSLIYSTALLPLHVATLHLAYDLLPTLDGARSRLFAVSAALGQALAAVPGLRASAASGGGSQIVHAAVPVDQQQVRTLAEAVRAGGFDARPIFPPTVAPGSGRLRLIAHAFNTETDAAALARVLTKALAPR